MIKDDRRRVEQQNVNPSKRKTKDFSQFIEGEAVIVPFACLVWASFTMIMHGIHWNSFEMMQ